jgi:hypothetical protein
MIKTAVAQMVRASTLTKWKVGSSSLLGGAILFLVVMSSISFGYSSLPSRKSLSVPKDRAGALYLRHYHKVEIANFDWNVHTHVIAEGWIAYAKIEDDGDLHIRLCDSPKLVNKKMSRAHCVVLEQIPSLCPATFVGMPKIGAKLRAQGISRFDRESNHGWWEIHPLESAKYQ